MKINQKEFKSVLGKFTTGITIISTAINGELYGFTANSFTAVSLDPALILFCIKEDSNFLIPLYETNRFVVNILTSNQKELSTRFSNSMISHNERFHLVELKKHQNSLPRLENCIAWLECNIKKNIKAGDHRIIIGKVVDIEMGDASKSPLLYYESDYAEILALS